MKQGVHVNVCVMPRISAILASLSVLLAAAGCGLARMWAAGGSYRSIENISYVPGSTDPGQRLDLFLPAGTQAGFPVVVFVHGGYWKNQDKQYYRAATGLYSNAGIALARQGFAAAVINYRLVPVVTYDQQEADVKAAIRWVSANIAAHGGNPGQLFLWGHSAGGHLSMMSAARFADAAGTEPVIRGVISMSGILDLVHMEKNNDAEFNAETTYVVFGRDSEVLRRYSPVEHLKTGMPPLLILTGSADYAYIREQTNSAKHDFPRKSIRADFHEIPGLDHSDMVLKIGTGSDPISPLVTGFIRRFTEQARSGTEAE